MFFCPASIYYFMMLQLQLQMCSKHTSLLTSLTFV
uniref:Uncharacterized protein n=1 Tax=Anguilla anguilla TaxID=7936 RepID=A0A0E9SI89_ANGAN